MSNLIRNILRKYPQSTLLVGMTVLSFSTQAAPPDAVVTPSGDQTGATSDTSTAGDKMGMAPGDTNVTSSTDKNAGKHTAKSADQKKMDKKKHATNKQSKKTAHRHIKKQNAEDNFNAR